MSASTPKLLKSKTTTAQPGSPANGDEYYLPTSPSPTGAQWSGQGGNLASYITLLGGWVFAVPQKSAIYLIEDEALVYVWTGSFDQMSRVTSAETLTSKTLTTPKIGTALLDVNGNEVARTPATSSAVNDITIRNAATGNAPAVEASGDDTNIGLSLKGKGTGTVRADSPLVAQDATASNVKVIAKGAASQSANIQEWQDSSGTVLSKVDEAGRMFPLPATFMLALGVDAAVGANLTNALIAPRAGKIISARAYAKTGPTGADLIFDVNLNGTTIWSTQANRLKIAAAAQSGSTTTFNTTTVAEGDLLTIDIDQIGSTIPGKDITVEVLMLVRNA